MQLVSVVVPYVEFRPPPPSPAELPLIVQLVSVAVPKFVQAAAARRKAELPLMVQLVSVAVPPSGHVHAAAVAYCADGGVAADGAVGQRDRSVVGDRPPPSLAVLSLTVQSVSVVVPPAVGIHAAAGTSRADRGVAADGAVGQREIAAVVDQAAAIASAAAGDRQSRDGRGDPRRPGTPGSARRR